MADIRDLNSNDTLTDQEYDRQIAEAIAIVNANHDRVVKEQASLKEETTGLRAKMQQVLNRLTGGEKVTKKIVIHFINDNNERYIIKTSDGELIGTIGINRPQLESKITLVNKRPVFIVFRGNEIYLKKDIMSGLSVSRVKGKNNFSETISASVEAAPMVEGAKQIYELVDNKDYDTIDKYITESMEKLIMNDDVESAQKIQRDAYIKAQVLYRNIVKIRTALASVTQFNESHQEILNQMDILYRQICEILINVGFYEIPEKVTRG